MIITEERSDRTFLGTDCANICSVISIRIGCVVPQCFRSHYRDRAQCSITIAIVFYYRDNRKNDTIAQH